VKFENVRGPFEVGLTFDLFLFEMRYFPARVLKLAQQDVGVLDELVTELDAVRAEPGIEIG
jgi:hypothetical protein